MPSRPETENNRFTGLENQIDDLKNQLECAELREDTHISEKKELHDRLAAEQEKTRLLMLPAPKEKSEKSVNWVQRLFGITAS